MNLSMLLLPIPYKIAFEIAKYWEEHLPAKENKFKKFSPKIPSTNFYVNLRCFISNYVFVSTIPLLAAWDSILFFFMSPVLVEWF